MLVELPGPMKEVQFNSVGVSHVQKSFAYRTGIKLSYVHHHSGLSEALPSVDDVPIYRPLFD